MKIVKSKIFEDTNDFIWIRGKSLEELLKKFKGKSLQHVFFEGVNNNYLELVKYCVEKGIDPSIDKNIAIRISFARGYTKIQNYLVNDDRVKSTLDNTMKYLLNIK